jgi:putative ABC transport system substrate-binding protein
MIRRRDLVTAVGGMVLTYPFAVDAQQPSKLRRVGILMPYAAGDSEYEARVLTMRETLAGLGWIDGNTVQFDERWTTDDMNRIKAAATTLLAANPDVVVTMGARVVPVLLQLSRTIPIVLPSSTDPVSAGWVESLARPAGNITGFLTGELSIFGKVLETLKQIAPRVTQVLSVNNPENPATDRFRHAFETAAASLGLTPVMVPVHGLDDIKRAFAGLADGLTVGVFFPPDLTTQGLREDIIALVQQHRLPAIYSDATFVKNGGLVYYGADRADLFRRAAEYVDRILRGEKAGDLPFQQPTKYQLMINLKTASALGLELSPMLLAQADEVIE